MDITISEELKEEGIARELVNRIQNLRKDKNFNVTDKIILQIEKNDLILKAIQNNYSYICSETLASSLDIPEHIETENRQLVELTDEIKTFVVIEKAS